MHSHLIPAVDDGCRDFDDSLSCARMLVDAGYSQAFCTPHVWPSLPGNTIESIRAAVATLQDQLNRANIPLKLHAGAEYNLHAMWPALRSIPREQIITYGLRGRHVLFDFWARSMRDVAKPLYDAIAHLKSLDLQPILAHPERIEALQREPGEIDRFLDAGVLLQMNLWSIAHPGDSPIYRTAAKLLRDEKYFLFGSDCHRPDDLGARLRGLELARQFVGEPMVARMTVSNPQSLLT